ncbi:MAG: hypothetical protein FWG16_04065 [Micrococcales bacterium]|nr:hypothetical protein [Micrococcales bacterium]
MKKLGVLAVGLANLVLLLGGANIAWADASVGVAGVDGQPQANLDGSTTLQVAGSGFESIEGGYGGIYVMFGTVKGSWQPSLGGVGGTDYLYVPDSQDKDNAGHFRFISFPGSITEATAVGVLAANGSWSADLLVPGPVFTTTDSSGQVATVDCRQVQCGVITIGAHAVINAANETFTPVNFVGAGTVKPPAPAATTPPVQASSQAVPSTEPDDIPEMEWPEEPETAEDPQFMPGLAAGTTLGVDATTAVAGHALAFTATGFEPGEQVVAVLDDGLVSAGPLTAGRYGELAGTLPLEPSLRVGTHVLKLTGAASQATASVEITVRRDPALVTAAEMAAAGAADGDSGQAGFSGLELAIIVTAGVLLLAVVFLLVSALVRRRRARRQAVGQPKQESPKKKVGTDWRPKLPDDAAKKPPSALAWSGNARPTSQAAKAEVVPAGEAAKADGLPAGEAAKADGLPAGEAAKAEVVPAGKVAKADGLPAEGAAKAEVVPDEGIVKAKAEGQSSPESAVDQPTAEMAPVAGEASGREADQANQQAKAALMWGPGAPAVVPEADKATAEPALAGNKSAATAGAAVTTGQAPAGTAVAADQTPAGPAAEGAALPGPPALGPAPVQTASEMMARIRARIAAQKAWLSLDREEPSA